MKGFKNGKAQVSNATIAYETAGSGPPVLLLHGFPQTREMWHGIAPELAESFTIVAADLRGYGASSKPEGTAAYSFRTMAQDMVELMRGLGHDRFHLVGHDRGARVSHRLALDHPQAVASLTLMDIVPTHTLLADLKTSVAKAYYHWFFLAQPTPFPETMIGYDPDAYFESCLTGWGSASLDDFDAAALEAYRTAWRDPACITAMCNDYRAGVEIDWIEDAADLNKQVTCPALVLYGAQGKMALEYDVAATWADKLTDMQCEGIRGGHFFPDENAADVVKVLGAFFVKHTKK
jgi:haloacetate dehalogenase